MCGYRGAYFLVGACCAGLVASVGLVGCLCDARGLVHVDFGQAPECLVDACHGSYPICAFCVVFSFGVAAVTPRPAVPGPGDLDKGVKGSGQSGIHLVPCGLLLFGIPDQCLADWAFSFFQSLDLGF